jgi:hypothetical protein
MDRRTFLSTAATAGAAAGLGLTAGPARAAAPHDDALLHRWFRATYRSMEALTTPLGLPADNLDLGGRAPVRSGNTSPTNIGCLLWSTVAARGLGVLSRHEALTRLDRTLAAVEDLERAHGFWFNWYDPATGAVLTTWPGSGAPVRPFLSTVDNAWLVTGLKIVAHAAPQLRRRAERLLAGCDWSFFFTPYDPADPVGHPGQLLGGYWTDDDTPTGFHYGSLNTEPRMASYHGIADRTLPSDHYWHLFRTLPPENGQNQVPEGSDRTVDGVRYFDGHYTYRGRTFIPTWGGSMFEALMVPLFVPEPDWSPRAWGETHARYVRGQIEFGLEEADTGFWGLSPCNIPEGGYRAYGVPHLGMTTGHYASSGAITPHASFLALHYAESEAVANLKALDREFGAFDDAYGFRDSVNTGTGRVSDYVLALDQGMVAAALAQRLRPGLLQRPFRSGGYAARVRPLLADEDFRLG